MGDSAPDVAEFQRDLVSQLALNGEVERIGHVRPEMRIQGFAGAARPLATESGKNRLRQSRSGYRFGSVWSGAIGPPSAEDVAPMRKAFEGVTEPTSTSTIVEVVEALHGLDGAYAQQRYQRLVHAVQTAIDATVATTDDRIFMAEDFARRGISVEVRAPGHRDARTEFAVVRVIGAIVARLQRYVPGQNRLRDCRPGQLALRLCAAPGRRSSKWADSLASTSTSCLPVASVGGCSSVQPKP